MTNLNILDEREQAFSRPLGVFALHADFAAGLGTQQVINHLRRLARPRWETCVEGWDPVSARSDDEARTAIARKAAAADVLIVGSSTGRLPSSMLAGLQSSDGPRSSRPSPGLMIGLLGYRDRQAGEARLRLLSQLARYAERMQLDFVWRPIDSGGLCYFNWLTASMSRLLRGREAAAPCASVTAPGYRRESPRVSLRFPATGPGTPLCIDQPLQAVCE